MSKRLQHHESQQIVHEALGAVGSAEGASGENTIGVLIPDEGKREHFRQTVQHLVRKKNFKIESHAIPVFQHTTIEQITQAIMSALPGDPYTPKPDDQPPPPPPAPEPKAFDPKLHSPTKKYEESH
jgi:hypothetical protein